MPLLTSASWNLRALVQIEGGTARGVGWEGSCRAFSISRTENGWWELVASAPMKVTQNIAGKLCVNGKPVGELIQGLFTQCTDKLDAFTFPAQRRFFGLMDEQGKAAEAHQILKFAVQP